MNSIWKPCKYCGLLCKRLRRHERLHEVSSALGSKQSIHPSVWGRLWKQKRAGEIKTKILSGKFESNRSKH